MRPRSLLLLVLALSIGAGAYAWADDPRIEARTHYQAGVKAYGAGDYKNAIKEFSAAQQIMPADLNNYNLALCYDKLGDPEPAIQYYREYLNKVPNADKRGEIEASISRLEGIQHAAQAKKDADAKAAADAKATADAKAAADAKANTDAKKPPDDVAIGGAGAAGAAGAAAGGAAAAGGVAVGVGSTGTPSTGTTVATGDAGLDRVSQIDINAIRDQRIGAAGSGMPDNRIGPAGQLPAGTGAVGASATGTAGATAMQPQTTSGAGTPGPMPTDQPKPPAEKPWYTNWWIWGIIAVGAFVLYEVATDSSTMPNQAKTGHEEPPTGAMHPAQPTGLTLWRF